MSTTIGNKPEDDDSDNSDNSPLAHLLSKMMGAPSRPSSPHTSQFAVRSSGFSGQPALEWPQRSASTMRSGPSSCYFSFSFDPSVSSSDAHATHHPPSGSLSPPTVGSDIGSPPVLDSPLPFNPLSLLPSFHRPASAWMHSKSGVRLGGGSVSARDRRRYFSSYYVPATASLLHQGGGFASSTAAAAIQIPAVSRASLFSSPTPKRPDQGAAVVVAAEQESRKRASQEGGKQLGVKRGGGGAISRSGLSPPLAGGEEKKKDDNRKRRGEELREIEKCKQPRTDQFQQANDNNDDVSRVGTGTGGGNGEAL